MYDLLIVGSGITAATLAVRLKDRLKVCIIDCRDHLGGNCFDYSSDGSFIHRYGPHIFHSPSARIVSFLGQFTEWVPYTHSVTAEIRDGDELRYVPFPYCRLTANCLGRELAGEEIIDKFYRGYSQKMWGISWEALPTSVRARVPKDTAETPSYYRDQFVALPKFGYTRMLENMFDGVRMILAAPPDEWIRVPAKSIVYTGRPDLIPLQGSQVPIAESAGLQLGFRTLDIAFASEAWHHASVCLHACTLDRKWTRKTSYSQMTGGTSPLVSTEWPCKADRSDFSPYYPIEASENQARYAQLSREIARHYPNLYLEGRLGSYRYLDMYQAVGRALNLANRLWNA